MAAASNPAKESLKQEQTRQAKSATGKDADLNKALEETFPASDPVAAQSATKPGAKETSAEKTGAKKTGAEKTQAH